MNHSTPGLPVHHQLLEFTQTHVYRVSDAIQASHPLLSPSLLTPNSSQHQGLFQWVNSSPEVAKVLEFQLQHHYFQRNPRADLLQNGLVRSVCSPKDSHESSPTPQFRSSAFFILGYWGPPWVSEAVPLARIMARWRLCTHQATAAFEGKQDKEERKLCLSICRPCITFPSWVLESQWEEWVYVWEEELMN